jgi:hypothetical protein
MPTLQKSLSNKISENPPLARVHWASAVSRILSVRKLVLYTMEDSHFHSIAVTEA